MRFWRTTSTEIGNLGSSQQNLRVYRIDGRGRADRRVDQGGADVYSPALVELPAHVVPGTPGPARVRWAVRRYRSDLRAGPPSRVACG